MDRIRQLSRLLRTHERSPRERYHLTGPPSSLAETEVAPSVLESGVRESIGPDRCRSRAVPGVPFVGSRPGYSRLPLNATMASGGRVTLIDCGWPCHETGALFTPPMLP